MVKLKTNPEKDNHYFNRKKGNHKKYNSQIQYTFLTSSSKCVENKAAGPGIHRVLLIILRCQGKAVLAGNQSLFAAAKFEGRINAFRDSDAQLNIVIRFHIRNTNFATG